MNKPTKHHYVPEFLLRNFIIPKTDPSSVYVYNLKYAKKRKLAPGAVAHQENFYSLTKEEELDPYFEKQFQKLETIAAPIIKKILECRGGHNLSKAEKTEFARFIGYSFVRTPQFFKQIENMTLRLQLAVLEFLNGNDADLKKIAQDSRQDPKEYFEKVRQNPEKYIIPEHERKNLYLGFMNQFGAKIANILGNDFYWYFLESQEVKYCISDDPVIFYSRQQGTGWRHGIGNDDVEIYFPLSPDICFIAFKEAGKFPDFSAQQINALNIWQAYERIFSAYEINFDDEDLQKRANAENVMSREEFMGLYLFQSGGPLNI
jgi:hypothetical protein